MLEWCTLLLLVITAPVQVVMRVLSRVLDKWAFWIGLPGDLKLLVWSLLSLGASVGAYFGGRALGCSDWPELAGVLYIAGMAIWAIWYNGGKHAERVDVQADGLRAELATLRQSISDPENQPSQWGTVLLADYNRLEADKERWVQAVGLASTALPDMVVDPADPIGMMARVVVEVERLRTELAAKAQ